MSNPDPTSETSVYPTPPVWARVPFLLISIVIALSTLPWILFSFGRFGGFDWALFGFELITLLGGAFGLSVARGKPSHGWALAVISLAGSWFVATVLGVYIGFYKAKLADFPDLATLARLTILTRFGLVVLAAIIASLAVFVRNPRSFKYLIQGLLWASPMIITAALVRLNTAPGRWISEQLSGASSDDAGAGLAVFALFVGVLAIVLISASGHMLIRAFECGRLEDASENPGNA